MDYKKMTMKDMIDYISANHNDEETKKTFKAIAYQEKPKTVLTTALDKNGQPKMYVGKDGKTKIKKKRVPIKTGEKEIVLNVLAAKKWFYDRFKSEIEFTNLPKTKKTKSSSKVLEMLENW